MKKIICGAIVAVVLLLGAVGLWVGLHHEEIPAPPGSSTALGLMLLERDEGLYVLAVTQDSAADKAGVHPGDYLLQAGEELLADASQLDAIIDANPVSIRLELRREDRKLTVVLPTR